MVLVKHESPKAEGLRTINSHFEKVSSLQMGSVEPHIPSCCNNLFADFFSKVPRRNQDESRFRRIHDGSQDEINIVVTALLLVKSWILEVLKMSTSDLAE